MLTAMTLTLRESLTSTPTRAALTVTSVACAFNLAWLWLTPIVVFRMDLDPDTGFGNGSD